MIQKNHINNRNLFKWKNVYRRNITKRRATYRLISNPLQRNFTALKLPMGRLKTGTPARIKLSTIDLSKMEIQPGDNNQPHGCHCITHQRNTKTTTLLHSQNKQTNTQNNLELRPVSYVLSGNITGNCTKVLPINLEEKSKQV